jgi:hypothetical protein
MENFLCGYWAQRMKEVIRLKTIPDDELEGIREIGVIIDEDTENFDSCSDSEFWEGLNSSVYG